MNTFSKKQRLKTKVDFGAVLQKGEKYVSPKFVVLTLKSTQTYPRLGLIVSKKVGNAIVRNKVKRRFREIFRQLSIQDKMSQRDTIIIARKSASETDFEELTQAVEKSFQWFERKLA